MHEYLKPLAALFAATTLVAACGGGGADAPAQPPVASPPAASPTPRLSLLAGNMGGAGNLDGGIDVARFDGPASIVVDASGNRYVSDRENHTIRKISADGQSIATFAGRAGEAGDVDGLAGNARFRNPAGLAIDGLFLYVADSGNRMVRRIRLENADVRTLAGSPDPATPGARDGSGGRLGSARFAEPVALALSPTSSGTIFVADKGMVRKVDGATSVSTIAGTLNVQDCAGATPTVAPIAADRTLCRVTGLAFRTGDVRLYFTDAGRHVVRALVPVGAEFGTSLANRIEFLAGSPNRLTGTQDGVGVDASFDFPDSMTANAAGELIIGQRAALRRVRLSSEGARVDILAGSLTRETGNTDGSRAAARFGASIAGLAIDANADIVVADMTNHLIRRFDPSAQQVGTLAGRRTALGGNDGAAADARFFDPQGIDLSADGSATLVDRAFDRVRRIDLAAGQVSTLAATPTESAPTDVVAAGTNRPAVVIGRGDHSVRVVENATARLLAGSGAIDESGFADGVGAVARFDNPSAIARDAAGTLWIADRDNHRIRTVAADGTTRTFAGAEAGHVDGAVEQARFDRPNGIAVTAGGEVFVLEQGNRAIRRIAKDAQGRTVVSTVAQGLPDPVALAMDEAGKLYVIDGSEHTVRRFAPGASQGEVMVGVPGQCGFVPGALPGAICRPRGIAVRDGRMVLTMDQGVLRVEPLPP